MNVSVSEHQSNVYRGTIPANGTLSQEFDLYGIREIGAIYSGTTNGTLSFQVAADRDADGGTYVDLLASNGTPVTFGPTGTSGAISGTVLEALRPYRFVKIKMGNTQAGVVTFQLPTKA